MKQNWIKELLFSFLFVIGMIGIYFYFIGRISFEGPADPLFFLPLLLYGLNMVYSSTVLRKKFPALLNPVILSISAIFFISLFTSHLTNHLRDFRPGLYFMAVLSTLLSATLYFISRNRPDVVPSEIKKRKNLSLKQELLKGTFILFLIFTGMIIAIYFLRRDIVDITQLYILLLLFLAGVNLIYCGLIIERKFPGLFERAKIGIIYGVLLVAAATLSIGLRRGSRDFLLGAFIILVVSMLFSIILYFASRNKPDALNSV